MPRTDSRPSLSPARSLWRSPEPYLVIALGLAIYATRISALTLRGEEPRRARVAYEMLAHHEWFVPTQQGLLFADRPPLGAWLMSLSAGLCGGFTTLAVRLPTILAVVATGVVVLAYARRFFSAPAAAAAACVFLTFGQVLQLGRLAECEGVFVCLMAAALLGWHALYVDGRAPWIVWSWGYAFAALAGLSKGPQGPAYFVAAVGAYLLLRRDWRFLFARGHFAGLASFAAIFSAWLVPYWLKTDAAAVRELLFHTVTTRLGDDGSLLKHVLTYPWQILGALLPWSPLLLRYADPQLRGELGRAREAVVFCTAAVAATFPTVWFAFGAASRHYMPLYPCFAVLVGAVVDHFTSSAWAKPALGWRWFLGGVAALMIVAAGVVSAAPAIPTYWASRVVQPTTFAWLLAAAALAATAVVVCSLLSRDAVRRTAGVFAIAGFLGLAYTGAVVNSLVATSEDVAGAIAAVKRRFPADARLVSLDRLDPLFVFHYRDDIAVVPWPATGDDLPRDAEYFAFASPADGASLPFRWESVAQVSCERNRRATPNRYVQIGRRINADAHQTADRNAMQRAH